LSFAINRRLFGKVPLCNNYTLSHQYLFLMNAYKFQDNHYKPMLGRFADQTGAQVKNQLIEMPLSIANGYTRFIELPGDISALLSVCTYNNDFLFHRENGGQGFYVLQFDDVSWQEYVKKPGTDMHFEVRRKADICFFSPGMDRKIIREKGMTVRSVKVILSATWLEKYMGDSIEEQVHARFFQQFPDRVMNMPMNKEMQLTMADILTGKTFSDPNEFYLQNRILLLIEKFLYQLNHLLNNRHGLQQSEYTLRIVKAEQELTRRICGAPPTVAELARISAMSTTSFKKYFKEVYGMPVYRYYIKLRLLHARNLMEKKGYRAADAGREVGYQNMHHFSQAYSKEFGVYPS
jgi:AraC-like DNA-binding protein